jgi:alpha-glutamyl/putrescinyl thymine pyrophosphorylase clade 1
MEERESVRLKKEAGIVSKPWSADPIFQHTYFCNVNRENDRVTKWIRNFYNPYVSDPMFEVNIGFARIINNPDTLREIGYILSSDEFGRVRNSLESRQATGQRTFGDAYIVSTNGRAMGKAQYVCEVLLPALYEGIGPGFYPQGYSTSPTLAKAYQHLMRLFGVASFMAGQFIGDFKNTPGHPLYKAVDKRTWSCPGPGSLRGLSWIFHGDASQPVARTYNGDIVGVLKMLREAGCGLDFDMQDLQNCLCEFDKYMRILNGTGRSKRTYPGG